MKKLLLFGGLVSTIGIGAAFAQSVDGIDIDRLLQGDASISGEVDDLVKSAISRSKLFEEEAKEVDQVAQKQITENKDRLAGILKGDGPVNLEEMINGAAANAEGSSKSPSRFIVFASLSMPKDALGALMRDTAQAGGVVVFRGFPKNSSKLFVSELTAAVKDNSQLNNVGIDPRLFRAFNVKEAPTFVAVESGFEPCDGFDCKTDVPAYDRMSGNVTVKYVLEQFEQGNGPGSKVARIALSRMEQGG